MERKKHKLFIKNMDLIFWDLLRWDLLLITQWNDDVIYKIFAEFNDVVPQYDINDVKMVLNTISWNQKEWKKWKPQTIEELIMMETFVMVHTHQSLESIRNRTVQYFFLISNFIPVALWHKKPEEVLRPTEPDRKKIKELTKWKWEYIV